MILFSGRVRLWYSGPTRWRRVSGDMPATAGAASAATDVRSPTPRFSFAHAFDQNLSQRFRVAGLHPFPSRRGAAGGQLPPTSARRCPRTRPGPGEGHARLGRPPSPGLRCFSPHFSNNVNGWNWRKARVSKHSCRYRSSGKPSRVPREKDDELGRCEGLVRSPGPTFPGFRVGVRPVAFVSFSTAVGHQIIRVCCCLSTTL